MRPAAMASESLQKPSGSDAKDIDDFIYLMSHDVRASVRALLELPQWIVEDLEDAGVEVSGSVANSIALMNRHTARLDQMLVDLLAYSRVGRMQDVENVDINACLEKVIGEVGIPEGMVLSRDIGCPTVRMGARDALLLLSALIGNAVKHHHNAAAGRIELCIEAEDDMVRITVRDDGPGIPERFHEKVICPMTTLRPRDEVEGTGMGLANVNKIAAHYGGHVSLSDAVDGVSGLQVDVLIPQGNSARP